MCEPPSKRLKRWEQETAEAFQKDLTAAALDVASVLGRGPAHSGAFSSWKTRMGDRVLRRNHTASLSANTALAAVSCIRALKSALVRERVRSSKALNAAVLNLEQHAVHPYWKLTMKQHAEDSGRSPLYTLKNDYAHLRKAVGCADPHGFSVSWARARGAAHGGRRFHSALQLNGDQIRRAHSGRFTLPVPLPIDADENNRATRPSAVALMQSSESEASLKSPGHQTCTIKADGDRVLLVFRKGRLFITPPRLDPDFVQHPVLDPALLFPLRCDDQLRGFVIDAELVWAVHGHGVAAGESNAEPACLLMAFALHSMTLKTSSGSTAFCSMIGKTWGQMEQCLEHVLNLATGATAVTVDERCALSEDQLRSAVNAVRGAQQVFLVRKPVWRDGPARALASLCTRDGMTYNDFVDFVRRDPSVLHTQQLFYDVALPRGRSARVAVDGIVCNRTNGAATTWKVKDVPDLARKLESRNRLYDPSFANVVKYKFATADLKFDVSTGMLFESPSLNDCRCHVPPALQLKIWAHLAQRPRRKVGPDEPIVVFLSCVYTGKRWEALELRPDRLKANGLRTVQFARCTGPRRLEHGWLPKLERDSCS